MNEAEKLINAMVDAFQNSGLGFIPKHLFLWVRPDGEKRLTDYNFLTCQIPLPTLIAKMNVELHPSVLNQ